MPSSHTIRLAVPSKGSLEEPTLNFLAASGLRIRRSNPRQYSARVSGFPGWQAVFQRAGDIPGKLADGVVDVGITGYDIFRESIGEDADVVVALPDLGFGRVELVLAVPDAWVDVSDMRDLVDVVADFRATGRRLRVATKFPRLVRDFLLQNDLTNFTLVPGEGAIEISPAMGYADIIADINETGTTLRANQLKTIIGGTILRSQTCLLINRARFRGHAERQDGLRGLLEMIEAHQRAASYVSVVANLRGESVAAIAQTLNRRPDLAGLQGPTISPVYAHHDTGQNWYAATVVVTTDHLLATIDHLRAIGGNGITVSEARYVFDSSCHAFDALLPRLSS